MVDHMSHVHPSLSFVRLLKSQTEVGRRDRTTGSRSNRGVIVESGLVSLASSVGRGTCSLATGHARCLAWTKSMALYLDTGVKCWDGWAGQHG